jgi:hypothetical protein
MVETSLRHNGRALHVSIDRERDRYIEAVMECVR